jgi:hypothetical protein
MKYFFTHQILFFGIVSVLFFGTFTPQAHAGVWGEGYGSQVYAKVYEDLRITLRGALTGALKQAVGRIMNTQITAMIGGGNGKGPLFIANWQAFLISDPRRAANVYINDFFSMTTSGRNSFSQYIPVVSVSANASGVEASAVIQTSLNTHQRSWLASEGIVPTAQAALAQNSAPQNVYDSNYYKYMTDGAKMSIDVSMGAVPPRVDLLNYVRGPSEIFAQGNWRGFNAFFSNQANNPFGYSLMAQTAYHGKFTQEQDKARTQATAYQGFRASIGTDGVTVKTPGINFKAMVDAVQNFSLESIISAQDLGTLISSGVTSAASMAINKAVDEGYNAAANAISEETDGALTLSNSTIADTKWNNGR